MTSARAQAYGRVMKVIDDVGPAKLLPAEVELLRQVSDTLLFADDPTAEAPSLALLELAGLIAHLEHSGRWTAEAANRLRDDVSACGPPAALRHAA
jgi:hypothetical protein